MAQTRKRVSKTPAKKAQQKKDGGVLTQTQRSEIISITLIAFGVFIIASFYFNACGRVGEFILGFCMGLLGKVAYALPVFFVGLGIYMIASRKQAGRHLHQYVALVVLLFLASAFFHLAEYDMFEGDFNVFDSFTMGQFGFGGGFFGEIVAAPLVMLFDKVGTIIILCALALIAFVVVTNFALTRYIGAKIRGAATDARDKAVLKKHEWEEMRQSQTQEEAARPAPKLRKAGDYDVFHDKEMTQKERKKRQPAEKAGETPQTPAEEKAEQEEKIVFDGDEIIPAAPQGAEPAAEPVIKLYNNDQIGLVDALGAGQEAPAAQEDAPAAAAPVKKEDNAPIDIEVPEPEEIPYAFPPLELFTRQDVAEDEGGQPENLRALAKKLVDTLGSFGVEAKVLEVTRGPSVTRFELQPKVGVKVSKITGLADDIALNLAAAGVRIEAPIPGKAAVGIEIPNKSILTVPLYECIGSSEFSKFKSKLAFALGKDISGKPVIADIGKMPHLLIAGATGSGKSVCINALVTSIIYKATPNEVKLVMIDPKVVELGVYNGIPHLLIPVVTDPRKAAGALNWAVQEMTNRYKLFAQNNVRDLKGYNLAARENGWRELEQIVIIIDELADLMMVAPKDVEDSICRLAQMARAAGMHLVIATQRPSVDVITGIIKANIPSRIAFAVSSAVDSRTILDGSGAEKLLGRGDMLFLPVGASKPVRIQGAFIPDRDVEKIVEYIKGDTETAYDEDILEKIENADIGGKEEKADPGDNDELLPRAIEVCVEAGQASVSLVQRRLKVGYSRAGRLIDQMEERGLIGPHEGSKPREVLLTKQQYYEMQMRAETIMDDEAPPMDCPF